MDNNEDNSGEMEKIINAFNTASLNVVKQMTNCKIEMGESHVKESFYPSYDYSIVIGVTGKYEGAVTMSAKEKTILFLASSMMGNKPINHFDALVQSAICELANMAVSRALIKVAGDDTFNITPPTFVRGTNVSLAVGNTRRTYVATFITPGGVLEFSVSLVIK